MLSKLLIAGLAFQGVNHVSANVGEILQISADLLVLVADLKGITTTPSPRSLNQGFNVLTHSMLAINGYGCWCYMEADDMHLGRGTPVDPIDQFCRYLIEGYACAKWDADNEGDDDCVPWEVTYNAGVSLGGFYSDSDPTALLVNACNNNNEGDNCKIRACIIEGFMITNIVDSFFKNIRVIEANRHINGFDPTANNSCKVKKWPAPTPGPTTPPSGGGYGPPTSTTAAPPGGKNLMSPDAECCGDYPIRAPFHPNKGLRGCCGNKSYDREMMQCCNSAGYQIKPFCSD